MLQRSKVPLQPQKNVSNRRQCQKKSVFSGLGVQVMMMLIGENVTYFFNFRVYPSPLGMWQWTIQVKQRSIRMN